MLRKEVAARIDPSEPGRQAWIAVFPVEPEGFRIRRFEVAEDILDHGYDLHPDHLLNVEETVVADVAFLDAAISRLGGDPDMVDAPWKVGYPL